MEEELKKKIVILEDLLHDETLGGENLRLEVERLSKRVKQQDLIVDQLERDLEEKNSTCLVLEQDNVRLQIRDNEWRDAFNKLSIEHELRGDQITFAISELKESLEARMPAKRRTKSEIPAPKPKKKAKAQEINLVEG